MPKVSSKKCFSWLVALVLLAGLASTIGAFEFSCQVCLYEECTPVGLDYGFANCWIENVYWMSGYDGAGPEFYQEICKVSESCEFPGPLG